jgi:predicted ATPase/transcriptional regulator with XRE-family HTH domain
MDTFGAWLRQQRNQLKLTREQFAERIGCSVALLRKIEDGERRPSTQIAELIANTLNIPEADRATFVRVARGELNLERLSAVLKSAASPIASSAPRVNLPVLPTPLIGRQHEVEKLSQLLREPHCRLLTLVGPGGMGKTRLAIASAAQSQVVFADGVYFVPLASINATRFIVPVIADAIGFTFQSASLIEPQLQLFNYLKEKQLLLVVDNLEHLLSEPGIEVLAELLAHAPHVKLLVTSRESVRLQDEWIFEVQGLPIPESQYAEDSAQNTSVELFVQRARRAHVGFHATTEDYPTIVRICQLVNGMPLGIELAAAWVRTLTCREIAQEIERGLGFLSVSTRDLPARHRSMRAVFDHSWKLLPAEEQAVLLRLSIFQGGFRREAAEQVAGATLAVLSTLVTKSLIRRSGEGRYDLHELIRQFAADHFPDRSAGEQTTTRSRHAHYYLKFFGQADGRLRSAAQREALAELTAEMDNFRSAWEWSLSHHDIAHVCQVSTTLWYVYELRSWFEEGESVFHDAAEAIQSQLAEFNPDNKALIAMHAMRAHSAFLGFRLGKSEAAYAALLPATTHLQSRTDQFAAIYALWYLGIVCWHLGKLEEATDCLQASLEKAELNGERWYEAMVRQFMGIIALDQGKYDPARRYLTEALASARGIGDPTLIAHILGFLGQTLLALGEPAEAEKYLRESLALTQAIGYRHGTGNALAGLGRIAQVNNPREARTLFAASCDVYRETNDLLSLSRVLSQQGHNALALGDVAGAHNSFIEILRLSREGGYVPYLLDALVGIASLPAKRGDKEQAVELVLVALNHPASLPDTKHRAGNLRIDLEAQLTRQQVEAAQERARSKTLESVVAEILLFTPTTSPPGMR